MKNHKPVIAVTCSSDYLATMGKTPRQIVSYVAYHYPVAAVGGIPVAAPECCAEDLAEICDGLLLSGGVYIEPALYGEQVLNDTVKCDPERSDYEFEILEAFMAQGKPIFGICRGAQVLNVAFGGTLYQDLPEQKGVHHYDASIRHPLKSSKGSILHKLFGEKFLANSYHHQAVKELADCFFVTAVSENDDIIEAYEHKELPIFAVQFHPERLVDHEKGETAPDFLPLFKYFIDLCAKHKQSADK